MSTLDTNDYQSGFGNEFASEALPGALPQWRNSPQRCPYSLYAEQLSGTAFTAPRHANRRSWLYRIRPSVIHGPFCSLQRDPFAGQWPEAPLAPTQLRWDPLPLPTAATDFIDGLVPAAGNGSPQILLGCGIPRGLRFRVGVPGDAARGYICENFGAPFKLPDLGPIGSNGLANARDFLTPRARYEEIEEACELVAKFDGSLWGAKMDHSPLDVVAWHGN